MTKQEAIKECGVLSKKCNVIGYVHRPRGARDNSYNFRFNVPIEDVDAEFAETSHIVLPDGRVWAVTTYEKWSI